METGIDDGFGLFSGFLLFLDFIALFLLFFLVKLGDLFLLFGAAGESVLHFLEFPDRYLVDALFQSQLLSGFLFFLFQHQMRV